MINQKMYDVAVIGAGAAGLAAGTECANNKLSTVIIDREPLAGGILRQCIHNGFGLRYFKEELTGPEYATRVIDAARESGAEFKLDSTVSSIDRQADGTFEVLTLSPLDGVSRITARAIMLAMGCRERNRGNIATPGNRPAGVFTAGAAQRLLNIEGMLPGTSAVIVGSGDIGLIMARRLTWSGVKVKAVVEIMPYPSGLTRNVVQCLHDFDIPLYLEHSVSNIFGRERVTGVEVAPLKGGIPQLDAKFNIDCDTVLFSVGLLPENELSRRLGVELNPATGGAVVDENLQTSVPGVFAGGNVLHVHDLVDFVSEEATRAARSIAGYLGGELAASKYPVTVGSNLKYAVPNYFSPGVKTQFSFRPLIVSDSAELLAMQNGRIIWSRDLKFVRPAEMLSAELEAGEGELIFNLMHKEQKTWQL